MESSSIESKNLYDLETGSVHHLEDHAYSLDILFVMGLIVVYQGSYQSSQTLHYREKISFGFVV